MTILCKNVMDLIQSKEFHLANVIAVSHFGSI